jgi:beta propeller repeat protein
MCYEKARRIYVYNFSTRKAKAISPKNMIAGACDISGTTLIWQGYLKGATANDQLYSYNLSTKKQTQLTKSPAKPSLARIEGKLVAWMDERNAATYDDIYMYNLGTHTESPVVIAAGFQGFVAVSAGRITWQDERNDGIYLYDVASGVATPVTSTGYYWNAAISGNRIVYQDDKAGADQVYLRTITPPVVKAGAPKSVAKGATPLVAGTLLTSGGVPLSGKAVRLQYSSNGSTWHAGAASLTNIDGKFTISGPSITKATYFRVLFAGSSDFAPAVSAKVKVKVT